MESKDDPAAAPAAAAPAPAAKCSVTFRLGPLAREVKYALLAPKDASKDPPRTWRLVPTSMRVKVEGLGPRVTKFRLPETCLPFGLLECIRVQGMPVGGRVGLQIVKATGAMTCTVDEATRWRVGMGLENTEFGNPHDAADPHLALVKSETGHVMAWRMIAAGSIGRVEVALTLPPFAATAPSELTFVFLGANAVKATELDDDLTPDRRVELLLPPLTPKERFLHLESIGPKETPASA